jgi:hypothetical protein
VAVNRNETTHTHAAAAAAAAADEATNDKRMSRASGNHLGVNVSVSLVTSPCLESPHGPIFSSRCDTDANISEATATQITADEWE